MRNSIRRLSLIVIALLLAGGGAIQAQNCCAPAVPQQGVLGETAVLPYMLDLGLHYEYLRSQDMYEGTTKIADAGTTRTDFKRATLTMGYGISRRLTVSAVLPYVWKAKSRFIKALDRRIENSADGLGDITGLVRYTAIKRDWVNFRELSFALGIKLPTGPTERRNSGFLLPQELQPGTGSYDWIGAFSFYQGLELVDLFVSATYVLTDSYEGYEFGNQLSYLVTGNFHVWSWLDASLAISGAERGQDVTDGQDVHSTGRHQVWLVPGVQVAIPSTAARVHVYYEHPLYQKFNGIQLGSDYNLRFSLAYSLQLFGDEGDQ